ncbi:MAG: hypothetical protein LBQ31_05540 [Bacteroidales bacterium]|jgi:hypothetical protein|nr:hypothetical protein [Bacteroidales bacterium]
MYDKVLIQESLLNIEDSLMELLKWTKDITVAADFSPITKTNNHHKQYALTISASAVIDN